MKRYIQYKDETDKTQVMAYDTSDVPYYEGPHDKIFDLINLIERG
ncbi:hypothetical protein [Weissella hellenica]